MNGSLSAFIFAILLTNGKGSSLKKSDCGIYRDDGLTIIEVQESGRTAERVIKPRLNKVFNSEDLKITIEPATQVTDYLDVKFNLDKHVHEPYCKPNDHPYGNTGCRVFKGGIQNQKGFWLKINCNEIIQF